MQEKEIIETLTRYKSYLEMALNTPNLQLPDEVMELNREIQKLETQLNMAKKGSIIQENSNRFLIKKG